MDNNELDFEGFDFDDAIIVTPNSEDTIEEQEGTTSQEEVVVTTPKKVVAKQQEEKEITEESETEESEEQEDNSSTASNSEEKGANFTALAKFFVAQGRINDFKEEDFDGSWEALQDMLDEADNARIDSIVNDYKSTLQPITKRIEDLIEGGVPQEDIVNHMKDVKSLQKISKEELTSNEDVQRSFLKQYYKETTKLSEKEINKMIDLRISTADTEDLPELFDSYSKVLVQKEKDMLKAVEDQEKEEEEKVKNTVESINKYINESKEFLGVKLSPQLRDQIKNEFKTVRLKDGTEANPVMLERAKNPIAFDTAVRIIKAFGLLNIDEKTGQWTPDLKRFKTNMTSKITQELADELGNGRIIKTGAAATNISNKVSVEQQAKDLEKMLNNL